MGRKFCKSMWRAETSTGNKQLTLHVLVPPQAAKSVKVATLHAGRSFVHYVFSFSLVTTVAIAFA